MRRMLFDWLAVSALAINFIGVSQAVATQGERDCTPFLSLDAQNQHSAPLNYDELITRPAGVAKPVSVKLGGRDRQFDVHVQTEWERRINLPGPATPPERHAVALLQFFDGSGYALMNQKAGGRLQLPAHWQSELQIAPLSSTHEHFHDVAAPPTMGRQNQAQPRQRRKVNEWSVGDRPEGSLTQELTGSSVYFLPLAKDLRDPFSRQWSDYVEPKYLVGSQEETSVYFDTDVSSLEKIGVAARLKTWRRRGGKPEEIVHRMLTLKVNLGEQSGFTRRQEVQTPWPTDLDVRFAPDVIREVLTQVLAIRDTNMGSLQARREVFNIRLGLRLDQVSGGQPRKVGFVTVDQFTVRDLLTGKTRTTTPISQLEIELFPQLADAVLLNPQQRSEMETLLHAIEAKMNGLHTVDPKYLQISR